MHEGFIKGEMVDKRKQDKWVVRQVGCRTGGMQDERETGQEGCRTGRIQDWKDAGLEGCRKRGIHERSNVQ